MKACSSRNLSVIESQSPSKVHLRMALLTAWSGVEAVVFELSPPPQPATSRARRVSAEAIRLVMAAKVGTLRCAVIIPPDDHEGDRRGFPPYYAGAPPVEPHPRPPARSATSTLPGCPVPDRRARSGHARPRARRRRRCRPRWRHGRAPPTPPLPRDRRK